MFASVNSANSFSWKTVKFELLIWKKEVICGILSERTVSSKSAENSQLGTQIYVKKDIPLMNLSNKSA